MAVVVVRGAQLHAATGPEPSTGLDVAPHGRIEVGHGLGTKGVADPACDEAEPQSASEGESTPGIVTAGLNSIWGARKSHGVLRHSAEEARNLKLPLAE